MTFLFDNNISYKIAKALHILVEPEHEVIHLRDRFRESTPDIDWLSKIRKWDCVVITGDYKIGKNPAQRKALSKSGKTTFFLKKGWMNQNKYLISSKMIKIFPDIVRAVKESKSQSFFGVTKDGKIERLN